eukprot:10845452-Alexandrium_andersonii.AAC.1
MALHLARTTLRPGAPPPGARLQTFWPLGPGWGWTNRRSAGGYACGSRWSPSVGRTTAPGS